MKFVEFFKKLFKPRKPRETKQEKPAFDRAAWRKNMRDIKAVKKFLNRHRVPSYVVVGLAQAGKSTLISKMPYHFVLDLHEGEEPPFVKVWCSDQAVFFELQADSLQSAKVCRLTLRRLKRYVDIRGVILCLACPDLLETSDKALSSPSRVLRTTLMQLQKRFHWRYPCHVYLTKSDQVPGYSDYMATLPSDEAAFFLDHMTNHKYLYQKAAFNKSYGGLLDDLQQSLPQILSYISDTSKRQQVYGLLAEMMAMQATLEGTLDAIFNCNRFDSDLALCRLDFVSMEQPLKTTPLANRIPSTWRQIYFFALRGFAVLLAAMLAGGFLLSSVDLVTRFHQQGAEAKATLSALPHEIPNQQLISMANLMDNIEDDKHLMADQALFDNHKKLITAILPKFGHVAQRQYAPQLMAALENQLQKDQGLDLYQTLRVYLMLAEPQHLDSSSVLRWFTAHGDTHLNVLQWYLASQPKAMPVNTAVVEKARASLYQLPIADLFYMTLKDRAINASDASVNLDNVLGIYYRELFTNNLANTRLLKLFTPQGMNSIYPRLQKAMLARNQETDWVLGHHLIHADSMDVASIRQQMMTQYASDYIQYWQSLLNNVSFRPWQSVATAQNNLTILAGNDSPLQQLLVLAQNNTQAGAGFWSGLFHHDQLGNVPAQIKVAFASLSGKTVTTANQLLHKDIAGLLQAMQAIPAGDANAMVKTSQTVMQGKFKALEKIRHDAAVMPAPFNHWADAIAKESVRAIFKQTAVDVAQQWQRVIVDQHSVALSEYPFRKMAKVDVSQAKFTQLVGPKGTATALAQQLLLPLIDLKTSAPKSYLGVAVPLSSDLVDTGLAINMVSQHWFTNKGALQISYTLTPAYLSNEAAGFAIEIGQESLTYHHGPALPTIVYRPATMNVEPVSLRFTALGGQQYTQHFTGTWALLRAINTATVQTTATANVYNLVFSNHGYDMKYQVAMPALGGFDLSLLQHMSATDE